MKRPSPGIDCYCWSIVFLSLAQAVPVARGPNSGESQRLEEAANTNTVDLNKACFYGNAVYAEGQNFTTSNPCETCICHPPAFACSLRSCDMKPGCKAIHSANKCCPEYLCECEVNGRMYANGEKVEEPNPCKVCYCKGGEIKCSELTCYKRDDCEPIYTSGICCPKYDHCPTLEMLKNKSTPKPSLVIISDLTTPSSTQEDKNTSSEEITSSEDISEESPEPTKPTTTRPNDGSTQSQSVATLEIIEIHPNMGVIPTTPSIFQPTDITKAKPFTEVAATTQISETTEIDVWTEDASIAAEDVSNDFETSTEADQEKKAAEAITTTTTETTTVPFEVKALPPLDTNDINLARMRNQSDDYDDSFENAENDTRSDDSNESVGLDAQKESNETFVGGNETLARNDFEEVENVTMDEELPARIEGDEVTTELVEETTTEAQPISKENLEEEPEALTEKTTTEKNPISKKKLEEEPEALTEETMTETNPISKENLKEEAQEEDMVSSDSQESTTTIVYVNTVENVEEVEKENIQLNNDSTTEEMLSFTTSESIVSSDVTLDGQTTETLNDVETVTEDDSIVSTLAPLIESTTVTENSNAQLKLEENSTSPVILDESSTMADTEDFFTSTIPGGITEFFKSLEEDKTARFVESYEEVTEILERFEFTTPDPSEYVTEFQTTDETTTFSEIPLSTVQHVARMISNTPETVDADVDVVHTTEDSIESSQESSQEIIEKDNLSESNDSSEWGTPTDIEDSFEELTTKQPQVYSTYMSILDRITVVPPEKIQEESVTEPILEVSALNPENDSLSEGYESENVTSSEESISEEESFSNSTAESAESIKDVINATSENIPFKYPSEDGSAPVMVMISADQIQYLKVGEEPPLYVENPPSSSPTEDSNNSNNQEIVIVPKTTPITVEMIKVVNGKIENSTAEVEDVDLSSELTPHQNSTVESNESLEEISTDDVDSTSDSDENEDIITKDIPSTTPSSNATGIIEER